MPANETTPETNTTKASEKFGFDELKRFAQVALAAGYAPCKFLECVFACNGASYMCKSASTCQGVAFPSARQ